MTVIGSVLHENPFFVPPDEFLRELRARSVNLLGSKPVIPPLAVAIA